jgi:hypothetical protein
MGDDILNNTRDRMGNAALGYAISWIYFFIVLFFYQRLFGKVKGTLIASVSSLAVWAIAVYALNAL